MEQLLGIVDSEKWTENIGNSKQWIGNSDREQWIEKSGSGKVDREKWSEKSGQGKVDWEQWVEIRRYWIVDRNLRLVDREQQIANSGSEQWIGKTPGGKYTGNNEQKRVDGEQWIGLYASCISKLTFS